MGPNSFNGLGFGPDVKERDLNGGNGGGVSISGEDAVGWSPLERDEINHCSSLGLLVPVAFRCCLQGIRATLCPGEVLLIGEHDGLGLAWRLAI